MEPNEISDDEAKKRVQEAVWTWMGRIIVLLVVFIFGAFTGWVLWGAGDDGAVQLRKNMPELQGKYDEQRKKVIDCEGKLIVVQGRLDEIQKAMRGATAPAAN
ncbi:MAG TPA: hypothetical protein VMS22_02260 [Candidatus Eisenbacteria bacterium]|nr:hypothetical protein [Candidatus Eisenbacteria bacterium]